MRKKLSVLLLTLIFAVTPFIVKAQWTPGDLWTLLGDTLFSALTDVNISINDYLNFNQTEGSDGFGVRSNSGTMEVKDSGGSWENIISGSVLPGEITLNQHALIVGNASNVGAELSAGNEREVLQIVGGTPVWDNQIGSSSNRISDLYVDDLYAINASIAEISTTSELFLGSETNPLDVNIVFKSTAGNGTIKWENDGSGFNIDNSLDIRDNASTTGLYVGEAIQLEKITAPDYEPGLLFFESYGALDGLSFYDEETDTTLNVGKELWKDVRNCNSGSTIEDGTAVYLTGKVVSQVPCILPASATTELNATVVGVTTHDIENNSNGVITKYGVLNDLNTNDLTDGDILYLATSTDGALNDYRNLTTTKPEAPFFKVRVGEVDYSHPTLGKIEVDAGFPHGLNDSQNVMIDTPLNNQLMSYNTSNGYWSNVSDIIVDNATTTNSHYVGSLGINSEYFTDLTGTNLENEGGRLDVVDAPIFSGLMTLNNGYISNASSTQIGDFTVDGNYILSGTQTVTGESYLDGGVRTPMLNATTTNVDNLTVNTSINLPTSSVDPTDLALTEGYVIRGNAGAGQATSDLFIKSDGNVGIGTTDPGKKLDIQIGDGDADGLVIRDSGNDIVILGDGSSGAENGYMQLLAAGVPNVQLTSASGVDSWINSGNVGIGTTAPDNKLHLNTSAGTGNKIRIQEGTYVWDIGVDDGSANFDFKYGGSDLVTIGYLGNVGIGTTGPERKLHVTGDANSIIRVEGSSTGRIELGDTGATAGQQNFDIRSDGGDLLIGSLADNWGSYVNQNIMAIQYDGNVGIGTTAPATKLHIRGVGDLPSVIHSETMLIVQNSGTTYNVDDDVQMSLIAGATGESEIFFGDFDDENPGRITYAHPTDSMHFQTNSSYHMSIDSFGKVGIGVLEPENLVHIKVNDAGIAPHASANLVVEDTGTNYLQMLTDNTSVTGILFGDTNDVDVGKVVYDHNRNDLELFAGGTELLTLDGATGYVGIGTTVPDGKLHVMTASAGTITPATGADEFVIENNTTGGMSILTPDTNNARISFGSPSNPQYAYIDASYSASGGDERMRFDVGGNTALYLDGATGNVSIGTTAPGQKLHVYGAGAIKNYIESTDDHAYLSIDAHTDKDASIDLYEAGTRKWHIFNDGSDNDKLIFQDDGDQRMVIQQDGNMGIGTTTPASLFVINGTTGDLMQVSTSTKQDIFTINSDGDSHFGGYVSYEKVFHAYGGFQDEDETIAVSSAGVWATTTNATGDLWGGNEADGITLSNDVMTIENGGDYTGNVSVSLEGLGNKDFGVRVYNITQEAQVGYYIRTTGLGNNNYVNVNLPLYLEVDAGDEFRFETTCFTDGSDPIFHDATFYIQYLHD